MSTENYAIDGETLLFFDKQLSALSMPQMNNCFEPFYCRKICDS